MSTHDENIAMVKRLVSVFGGGNLNTIGAATHATQNTEPRATSDRAVPFVCVHAAAIALDSVIDPALDSTVREQQLNARLREACIAIRDGHEIPRDTSSPAARVQTGALRALAEAYRACTSVAFTEHAVAYLCQLYIKGAGLRTDAVEVTINAVSEDLLTGFRDAGIEGINRVDVTATTSETALAADMMNRRLKAYLEVVDQIYSKIAKQHFARAIVDGLANGSIEYSSLTRYASLEISRPLDDRAEEVRLQKEAAAARLGDLGWIAAELELDTSNMLGIVVLPPDEGEAGRPAEHDERAQQAAEKASKIEPYRLYVLAVLKAMWPGTRFMYKLVAKGKAEVEGSAPGTPESDAAKLLNLERYAVLVFPNGDFIAEFPEPNHATILYRSISAGREDPNAFETVLLKNIATAVARYGAVRIEHPRREDLEANRQKTVEAFINLILEDLTTNLAPGETLPDHKRMRRLRRVGGTAVGAS
jgi:hypothetical protein